MSVHSSQTTSRVLNLGMEAYKPGLEICSSTKELSRFDGASNSEQIKNKNSIKMERASYHCNLEIEPRNKGAEMAMNKSMVLGSSSSKVNHSCKGKAVLYYSSNIEEINERMRILEEETESMKQELYEGAQERRRLINEIHQQFQILKSELKLHDGRGTSETYSQDERLGRDLSEDLQHDLIHTLSLLMLEQ